MSTTIRYGTNRSLPLELASATRVEYCDAPRGKPLADVSAAVDRALAEPIGYPPLEQAALPGDRVVLALENGVPQAATIVARTIDRLLGCGVEAGDITVLRAQAELATREADPLDQLSAEVRKTVVEQVHDPANRDSLSYLAASADAKPIYIDRAIHDADLVITIGKLRLADSPGYYGVAATIFPTFSNSENVEQFRWADAATPAKQARLRRQADEVSWLLGSQFTIQVVPGPNDAILHVLAGESRAVAQAGSRLCEEAWSFTIPHRANLVVATIVGDAREQTWENVGRALHAASQVVGEDGAVAICSDLSQNLGPGLQRLQGADDLEGAAREILKYKPSDALVASELIHALKRGKVYLVSRLADEQVEDLGVAPVAGEQLSRLAARYDSCLVLTSAQYSSAHVAQEPKQEKRSSGPRSRK